jgi:hypothetical protein
MKYAKVLIIFGINGRAFCLYFINFLKPSGNFTYDRV